MHWSIAFFTCSAKFTYTPWDKHCKGFALRLVSFFFCLFFIACQSRQLGQPGNEANSTTNALHLYYNRPMSKVQEFMHICENQILSHTLGNPIYCCCSQRSLCHHSYACMYLLRLSKWPVAKASNRAAAKECLHAKPVQVILTRCKQSVGISPDCIIAQTHYTCAASMSMIMVGKLASFKIQRTQFAPSK